MINSSLQTPNDNSPHVAKLKPLGAATTTKAKLLPPHTGRGENEEKMMDSTLSSSDQPENDE